MAIESINPATNKLLRSYEALTNEAARQKIALADDGTIAVLVEPGESFAHLDGTRFRIAPRAEEDYAALFAALGSVPERRPHCSPGTASTPASSNANTRLGFLLPRGNPTIEPEMMAMVPQGVSLHFHRMVARGAPCVLRALVGTPPGRRSQRPAPKASAATRSESGTVPAAWAIRQATSHLRTTGNH